MNVISRKQAIKQGLKNYFTGKPCKHGHVYKRSSCNGLCGRCSSLRALKWHYDNPDKAKEKENLWRANNKAVKRIHDKKWRTNNPDKVRLMKKFHEANRRARKRNALPVWQDRKQLKQFYDASPKGFQVDHIVPLMHSKVCGLHVIVNLQYLSEEANHVKKNSFQPYYELPDGKQIIMEK